MLGILRPAFVILLLLSAVCGVVYPLAMTGIAQVAFPEQANGSIEEGADGLAYSSLIGQPFEDARYFWGRPSATTAFPYDASAGSGSNLGPTNPALIETVKRRVAALRTADPKSALPIPVDLVSASGSGLDPHVSPAAALYQVQRVARARGLDPVSVRRLIAEHTAPRQLGFLGEPRVNVLELNLALDATR